MRLWLSILATLAACGGESSGIGPDAGEVEPPDSSPLYEPDHIVQVDITMAASDWDELCGQTRTFNSVLEGDCLAQPIPSPFTTFPAAVTIDGTELADVGVHKKGFFGSLSSTKPSLKLVLDYLGLGKITLNNANQDPSYLRQCLTYGLFAAAGVKVPRCNFAHVRVNGADLGIYVNVETLNHDFTRRVYDGEGALFEGTLSDFRPEWIGTFDAKGDSDRAALTPLVDALAITDDAAMLAALDGAIDLDRFYTYWAMEVITAHWDGYANDKNNFYVYADETTGRLDFIPWGVDATFQAGRTFGGFADATTGPNAVAAAGYLASRLFAIPETRAAFLARERELLDTVWDEDALDAELDRMEQLISPVADDAGPGWHDSVDEVRAFVAGRRALLTAELDAGPTWPFPLDGYPCLDVVAQIDGTFSTTYGTLGADPFASGTGTWTVDFDGTPEILTPIGATAGLDPNPQPGSAATDLIEVFGGRSNGHVLVALFSVPRWAFGPGSFDVGFFGAFGIVFDYDPATNTAVALGSDFGSLQLAQASEAAGAPVAGSFSAHVDTQGSPPAALKVQTLPRTTLEHLAALLER